MQGGMKNHDFQPIFRFIAEIMLDGAISILIVVGTCTRPCVAAKLRAALRARGEANRAWQSRAQRPCEALRARVIAARG